jgi:hypothetical protein
MELDGKNHIDMCESEKSIFFLTLPNPDRHLHVYPNNQQPINMKKTQMLFLVSAMAIVIAGCKKEETTGLPNTPVAPGQHALFQVFEDNLTNATQHFTLNVDGAPGYVQGAHGFYGAFAINAFRHADGTAVTGNVDIDLVEAYTVGQMLLLNKQTMGLDGGQLKPLVSGGQFRLRAFQNGSALKLAPGGAYIGVPTNNVPDPNMSVFSGNVDDAGTITWSEWPANPIVALDSVPADSTGGNYFYYNFPSDSLGWINCDYFSSSSQPLTGVQVTCPVDYDHSNTMVWIVFPDLNSMTNVWEGVDNVFATGSWYTIPVGLNITVVALAEVDGEYFSSFSNAVVSDNLNLNITMQPTTLAAFDQAVGGL